MWLPVRKLDERDLSTINNSALTIDGLTKAETAFNQKTEPDGFPLAIDARIMLVPTALRAPASALMNSLEIRKNIGAAYPTANPHTGKFRLVKSAWLGSPVIPGADDRAWQTRMCCR